MIRHIVLLKLPIGHDTDRLDEIMNGLDGLQTDIDGFGGFEHGPNLDFEKKLPDHPYGFICTFRNPEAVKAYAEHPKHEELSAALVDLCGGSAGILVIDLNVGG